MIITKLQGGLGNQLFQYAAGRALAARHRVSLWFETGFYEKPSHRGLSEPRAFLLAHLCCSGQVLDRRTGAILRVLTRRPKVGRLARLTFGPGFPRPYRERHFHYDPDFHALPSSVLLEGYWQSERYFHSIETKIRDEIKPRSRSVVATCQRFLGEVRRRASVVVSVHVRRGDYVLARQQGTHALLTAEYFRAAMKQFGADAAFVVCSDDRGWCERNLCGPGVFFSPGIGVIEDLFLMSLCDHHVISNSTFSWWSAWLGANPARRVLVPPVWFGPACAEHDVRDLFPPGWEMLDDSRVLVSSLA